MKLMVIGVSKGLGKAFVKGLCSDGDMVIGLSPPKATEQAAN